MKLLLDEMMPAELGQLLVAHEVSHVVDLGWRHISNGQLLELAESRRFEVLITKDGNLPYQQNMSGRDIAILVLRPKNQSLPALLTLAPAILRSLATPEAGTITTISG